MTIATMADELETLQGLWTEAQYLRLSAGTNNLIEFTDGYLEILPMPTGRHQMILRWLFLALFSWEGLRDAQILFAPLRLQVRPGVFREPDVLVLLDAADPRGQDAFWLGADLVMEIVSPDNPKRDTVTKRADYALAQIPEYWIVNPLEETLTVLTLDGAAYAEHGVFARGTTATSVLISGFSVSVDAVLDAR